MADPAQTDTAASIMATIAGRTPERSNRHQLTVPVDSDNELFEITRRFREHALSVTELSLRLPSLDEVFSALTARAGEEAQTLTEAAR